MIVHLSAIKGQISQMKSEPRKGLEARKSWDWTSAGLLLLGVLMASWRLVATGWTDHLFRLQFLALVATIFGLALGASRFPRWLAVAFGAAYGAFFIPWQLGLTILGDVEWQHRLINLWGRLVAALQLWGQRENVYDPILFWVQMALILWWLGAAAGFALGRHRNPWLATLPMAGMLVILHTYDAVIGRRIWYLAAYIFFVLLLVARVRLLEQRDQWRANGTHLPTYLGLDMLRANLLAAGVLVVLAWVTPALAASDNPVQTAWEAVTAPWRRLRDEFGGAYYSLEAAAVEVRDYYGKTLALGRGNALTDTIILTVQVPDEGRAPPRYYWRDRVYDQYAGGRWTITFEGEERLRAEENKLFFPEYTGRTLSKMNLTTGRSIFLLHAPSQPLWVDRTVEFDYALNPDGSWDIAALRTPLALRPGETYQVDAYLATPTITQLREAGTDYPDWVLERYLEVPPEITVRTLELGQQIAEGQETPYDVAAAVTNWLRENIAYQESIELPPPGYEPIDWMLFEGQVAFCNYYATAEVILLRSLGIPARMAVGYAQGEQTQSDLLGGGAEAQKDELLEGIVSDFQYYAARQRDAHAWPEVFFPNIGWVEFEPTVNQAALVRPLGEARVASDTSTDEAASNAEESTQTPEDNSVLERLLAEEQAAAAAAAASRRLRLYTMLGAALGLMIAALFWRRHRQAGGMAIPVLLERGLRRLDIEPPVRVRNWAQYAGLAALPQAYMEINAALRRVGASPQEGDTPRERAAALKARLPKLAPVVDEVSGHYQRWLYGRGSAEVEGAARAKWAIRLASWGEMLNLWGESLPRMLRRLGSSASKLARRQTRA
jgi:transglutaminase-like putative cysteine protease